MNAELGKLGGTTMDDQKLEAAIRHAVNYHSLDARLNMSDREIAALITPEVSKHLQGKTDVQIIEAMTPDQRLRIGDSPIQIA